MRTGVNSDIDLFHHHCARGGWGLNIEDDVYILNLP